jgi:hypothetical protein
VGRLKIKNEELASYQPPPNDPRKITERAEIEKVYQFLTGLDPSYEPIRAQILLSTETPSFNTVIAILQREETHIKTMSQNPTNLSENNSIFLAKTNTNTNLKKNGQNLLTCTNYKKNGHNRDGC